VIELLRVILFDAFWSALAALGFAMLFNVPRRVLIGCVLTGALGHATRAVLMHFGMTIVPATLAGAMVIGFLAEYCGRQLHAPPILFAVSGAIPMVPGSYAFKAMLGVIRVSTATTDTGMAILVDAGINFVATGLILAALALGTTMPSLLFRRRPPLA
jgi:uncharacterized membrane protein YjjB (DUF3815 family)